MRKKLLRPNSCSAYKDQILTFILVSFKSVKTYYQGLIDETSNNPKEMWKSVSKVLNKDKVRTSPSSVTYKGQNLENPRGISEAFNDHFVTIGPKLTSEIQSEATDDPLQYLSAEIPSDTPPFVFQRIDENLVKREINS